MFVRVCGTAGVLRNPGGMLSAVGAYPGHALMSAYNGVRGYNPSKVTRPPNMYNSVPGFDPKVAMMTMLSGGSGMGGGRDPMGGILLGPMGPAGFMRSRLKDEDIPGVPGDVANSPMGKIGIPAPNNMNPLVMQMLAGGGAQGGGPH